MSGQVWAVNSLGGYMYSMTLSKKLRMAVQPKVKFRLLKVESLRVIFFTGTYIPISLLRVRQLSKQTRCLKVILPLLRAR
jgi:hypothetical protein